MRFLQFTKKAAAVLVLSVSGFNFGNEGFTPAKNELFGL